MNKALGSKVILISIIYCVFLLGLSEATVENTSRCREGDFAVAGSRGKVSPSSNSRGMSAGGDDGALSASATSRAVRQGTSSFLPTFQDSWTRRGKVLGFIGAGITAAIAYRLRQTGWKSPLHLLTSTFMSKSNNQPEDSGDGRVIAVGAKEDLEALQESLSVKDRAIVRFDVGPAAVAKCASTAQFAAERPFDTNLYFDLLKSKSLGRVLLYSPTLTSTQTTLFSQLETEKPGLICLADRFQNRTP
jgi:hypothetical protein